MADDTPDQETPEPATRRRKSPPPVQPPVPAPEPEPAPQNADAAATVPEWLRYVGQTAAVFMDLGGEIEPGQVVRPRDAALAELLLTRSPRDFEPAEAPATDAESGTAH